VCNGWLNFAREKSFKAVTSELNIAEIRFHCTSAVLVCNKIGAMNDGKIQLPHKDTGLSAFMVLSEDLNCSMPIIRL